MNFSALLAARSRAQTAYLEAQAAGASDETIQARLQAYAEASAAVDAARDALMSGAGSPGPDAGLVQRARAEGGAAAIVTAAMDGRAAGGAIEELQAETRVAADEIPIDLILSPSNAVTPAPDSLPADAPQPISPMFSTGLMSFLGVMQRRVASGDLIIPTLSTRPTVARKGPDISDAVAETTGAFAVTKLEPQRLQAGFSFRRTEAVQLRGLDQALSAALNMALSEDLDSYVASTVLSSVAAANSAAHLTFETWRSTVYGLVDGRHATSIGDIRLAIGSLAYADAAANYNGTGDRSALASLQAEGVRFRVTPHAPAVANKRQSVIARLGMADDATMALWPAVTLIRDQITKAAEGEIKLTAVMLASFGVTRADGWKHIGAQINA